MSSQDLESRLALCSPEKTIKGGPIRSVCAELEKLPPSPLREQLLATHRKAAWQELASFPVADFLRLVYATAGLLAPQVGSFERGLTHLGFQVADAFLKSVVGRLAVMMASGKTPLDILAYAPATYAPVSNYGKRTFARVGPTEAVFRIREDHLPAAYHLGVVRCGVAINGGNPEVEVTALSLLDCDVHVRWDPSRVKRAS